MRRLITTFRWMDRNCTVDGPEDVVRALETLLPQLLHPNPAAPEPHVRIVPRNGGFSVVPSQAERWACLTDAVSAAELAVTRTLLAADRERCHLHAAGAVLEDHRAILAVGPSGSGKSTAAWAWHRMALPVLGDDVVALDAQGRAHPFPRPLKVDAARLRDAGEPPEETVGWAEGAEDVWVDPTKGAGWAPGPVTVCLFASIRFIPGAETRAVPVAGGERLRVLLDAVHQTGASRRDSLDRLIRLAEEGVAYRVEHGGGEAAAALLLELARRPH